MIMFAGDGSEDEVKQLIEGYIKEIEELRYITHALCTVTCEEFPGEKNHRSFLSKNF